MSLVFRHVALAGIQPPPHTHEGGARTAGVKYNIMRSEAMYRLDTSVTAPTDAGDLGCPYA